MTNTLLNDEIVTQVTEAFTGLVEPVAVLFFGRKQGCEYCEDTLQLVREVTDLSDKLSLKTYDLDEDAEIARKFHVDKAPGLVLAAEKGGEVIDYGIRYAGIPSGHEFTSLINDLLIVSSRDSGLSQEARTFLADLQSPVHLQVFVTPSCPYCPRAVVLAHQMALESPKVEAEMVEAIEFPDLAERFAVSGVPQTTINHGAGTVVGAVPEMHLVEEIRAALGMPAS